MSSTIRHSLDDFNGVRDQVVKLRCLGHSLTKIAKTLNISYFRVKKLVESEFQERFANREDIKCQTAMQLDFILRPLLENYEAAPDRRDAEAIVKIIDRKCKLLGLDEAVKVDVRQVESLSDDELEKELARHGVVKQLSAATEDLQLPIKVDDIQDAEFTVPDKVETTNAAESIDSSQNTGLAVRETAEGVVEVSE